MLREGPYFKAFSWLKVSHNKESIKIKTKTITNECFCWQRSLKPSFVDSCTQDPDLVCEGELPFRTIIMIIGLVSDSVISP